MSFFLSSFLLGRRSAGKLMGQTVRALLGGSRNWVHCCQVRCVKRCVGLDTSGPNLASSNKCLTSSNKKLVETIS